MSDTITLTPRLVRIGKHCLRIEGLRCGLQKPLQSEPCGGELLVQDWHPRGVRGEFRYEIFCDTCKECDPNGWPRQDQLVMEAKRYFEAKEG